MVHPTPEQDKIVERSGWPAAIRRAFKEFEVTFVILHPFMKIKPNCNIEFETGDWPAKDQIIICTERIFWAEVISETGLGDICELDRLLAYFHCARKTADKAAWIKLRDFFARNYYIAAEVDYLPDILINNLMAAIKVSGYVSVHEYTEFNKLRLIHAIDDVIANKERAFWAQARIVTPDNQIKLATDFDQRFTYLSSTRNIVDKLIEEVNLEGFFCSETTRADWSYIEQTENLIDWAAKNDI